MLNPIPNDQIGNYYVGTPSEVWLYKSLLLPAAATIPVTNVTISTAAAVAATTLTVVALPAPIARNQRIATTGGKCFIVTAPAALGATSLTVAPLISAVVANDVGTYAEVVPYYSAMEAGIKADGQEIEFRNFGAGAYAIKGKTKLSGSFDTNGYVTRNDPGLPLVRAGANSANILYVEFIYPDDSGVSFYSQVKSLESKTKVDEAWTIPVSFTLSSAPRDLNYVLR
jgi:hypothetical protein